MTNPAVQMTFGYNWQEIKGNTTEMLYADKEGYAEQGKKRFNISADQHDKPYEMLYRKKDGTVFVGETLGTKVIDSNGSNMGFIGIIRDITDRKFYEKEQLRLQRRLEAQWEIARMVDEDQTSIYDFILAEIVDMTDSKHGFYGYLSVDEGVMTIHTWSKEVMKDCGILDKPIEFSIEKSGVWGNAVRERKILIINNYTQDHPNKKGIPEGHVSINRLMVIPIFRSDRIAAIGAVANKERDYTDKDAEQMNVFLHSAQLIQEKREAEEQLKKHREQLEEMVEERTAKLRASEAETVRASQLASLGQLAAGVAHEVNNPINGIINLAQMLSDITGEDSKEHDVAGRIINEGDRIANIVSSLLSFARHEKDEKMSVSVVDILSDSLSLTRAQLRKDGINVVLDMPSNLPSVIANFQKIEQVFINIINNARYALNQKYSGAHEDNILTISGKTIDIEGCGYVRVIFYDSGSGIPDEVMDKIVDPFFSTKPRGKGTGLGLSISHGIISDHGGHLKIESVKEKFTKVIIDLPLIHAGQMPSKDGQ
jgi:PAS domain S-box-containing protein